MKANEKRNKLTPGIYKCVNPSDEVFDPYYITMRVKETEKSYIFELIEFECRYCSADRIKMLFDGKDKAVVRKERSPHAMRVFAEGEFRGKIYDSFVIYPYRDGIPYVFNYADELN